MHRFTAKSRIAFGLVSILASILFASQTIGIQEDAHRVSLEARARLTEVVAVNCCILASTGELEAIRQMLEWITLRNPDLLGATLIPNRVELGTPIIVRCDSHEAASHPTSLDGLQGDDLTAPVFQGDTSWGTVSLRFAPLPSGPQTSWFLRPANANLVFVCACSFILFFVYLGAVLKYLDPSKAVPDRVRSALDTLAEGLMVLDSRGQIVLVNQAFAKLMGTSQVKLVGTSAKRLPWRWSEHQTEGEHPWEQALQDGLPREGDTISLEINRGEFKGQRRILLVNSSPVSSGNAGACGVFVSFEDITQLEATKIELMHAKEAAEAASSAKSSFLANMSHEIRTPMNAILGFTDVLRRGLEPNEEKRLRHLETIHRSGTHLLNLINDILDLSKVEAGRFEVESISCDPHEIVADVVAVLQSRADEKGLKLLFRSEGPVPQEIFSDPGRLRQILTNLIGNAIKFTAEGHVDVVASLVESPSGHRLQIRITDTGVGMSQAALGRIFDPFSQADSSITRRFGGTGLGLAISRKFARAMGGDITVASKEGVGSQFSVSINPGDVRRIPRVDWKNLANSRERTAAGGQQAIRFKPARVLVVEDGAENRELITLVLQQSGLEVATATNGREGVDQALADRYDLIMMDMQMPIMDGYTAARTMRQHGLTLPIVALTAHAMKGDEQKCLDAGCSDFLTKPINIDLLLQKIADILQRVSGQPSAEDRSAAQCQPDQADAIEAVPSGRTASSRPSGDGGVGRGEVAEGERLRSTLPTAQPQFRAIVQRFVGRLDEQLREMQRTFDHGNFEDLAGLAHWLKGTGGTVGFPQFLVPSQQLEDAAKSADRERCQRMLHELSALAKRIESPESHPNASAPNPGPANPGARHDRELAGV